LQITKLYEKSDCSNFDGFGRILSGTLEPGATVKVLGEGYSLDDEEDMTVKDVSKIWIFETR
jgi:U5 small nuclear ribonucleoprotein component